MANPAPGFEKYPNHTVEIEPGSRRLKASALDRKIASSDQIMMLREARYPEVAYIPIEDLDASVLIESETTTYCPFKGHARYFHVHVGEHTIDDAIWYYPDPYDECLPIKNFAAFYTDKVDVVIE